MYVGNESVQNQEARSLYKIDINLMIGIMNNSNNHIEDGIILHQLFHWLMTINLDLAAREWLEPWESDSDDSIDRLVIMNSKIAVCGSLIMNYLASFWASNGRKVASNWPTIGLCCLQWGLYVNYPNEHFKTASLLSAHFFPEQNIGFNKRQMNGNGWMTPAPRVHHKFVSRFCRFN